MCRERNDFSADPATIRSSYVFLFFLFIPPRLGACARSREREKKNLFISLSLSLSHPSSFGSRPCHGTSVTRYFLEIPPENLFWKFFLPGQTQLYCRIIVTLLNWNPREGSHRCRSTGLDRPTFLLLFDSVVVGVVALVLSFLVLEPNNSRETATRVKSISPFCYSIEILRLKVAN